MKLCDLADIAIGRLLTLSRPANRRWLAQLETTRERHHDAALIICLLLV